MPISQAQGALDARLLHSWVPGRTAEGRRVFRVRLLGCTHAAYAIGLSAPLLP